MKLRLLDLFSGIGGFSLGLERSGLCETVAFCEIEDFPRRVLAKHWPKVPIYDDVRTLTASRLAADGIANIDIITGGFPCQDLSIAGNQAGIESGTRSGLWSEIVRLACEIRPKFIIVENVANLLRGPSSKPGRWFGRVLGDLAECGYDAEWHRFPAALAGRPIYRDRLWLVAFPVQVGQSSMGEQFPFPAEPIFDARLIESIRNRLDKPPVLGVANGIPNQLDRLGALGNAVVPQIPELIGRAILAALNNNQQHGLAISTPILRADAGKNACSVPSGVKLVPACFHVASKDQDSAPPVSNNPRPSIDGLPCASPPGANLAGGGLSNLSQPLYFQSGDHFPKDFPKQKEREAHEARQHFENLRKSNQGGSIHPSERTLWHRIED